MVRSIFTSKKQERRLAKKRFEIPIREASFKQAGGFGFELSKVDIKGKPMRNPRGEIKVLSSRLGFKTRAEAEKEQKKELRRLTKLRL